MRLVKWDPFREFTAFSKQMSRQFDQDENARAGWTPAVDIFERDDNLVIRAEIPGVKKDEIDIQVENDTLTIRGERKRETEIEEKIYRSERAYGSFTRSFGLAKSVDASKITAAYDAGVLELTLPRAEQAKPKKIAIKAA